MEIERIKKSLQNRRFLAICFTEAEIEYCRVKGAASFAGYFAAKESVAKALGSGFRGFYPREIEICRDDAGRPFVKLSAKISVAMNSSILISISHEKSFATAMAIILG